MEITIDLDELTVARIDQAAATQIGGRDMLIWRAINQWLSREEEKYRIEQQARPWPKEVMAFQGVPDVIPFESYREELLPLRGNPFA